MHGLLVLDKPLGVTSRAAVNRVQDLLPPGARIGHTGTLDPLASGVLVLCLGQATRLAMYVQRMEKVYRAGVRLGGRSATDDAQGPITWTMAPQPPLQAALDATLPQFVGEIEQTPPTYSAAKVEGRRAYDLARTGRGVALRPRRVPVYEIQLLRYEFPHLDLEVRCGRGTYIRALARDLGNHLGCGAFLESLRRTRVGGFHVEEAMALDESQGQVVNHLLPVHRAVDGMPRWTVDFDSLRRLRKGQRLPWPEALCPRQAEEWAVFALDGTLAGLAHIDPENRIASPTVMFPEG